MRFSRTLRLGEQFFGIPIWQRSSREHPPPIGGDNLIMQGKMNAYVLAGGESRRFGSNKLFARIGGETLLAITLGVCESVFERAKIVAKSREGMEELKHEIIVDYPDAKGPMAGLIAALEDCPHASCFITAADLYGLRAIDILELMESYEGEDYLGFSENGFVQPLLGIYSKAALSSFILNSSAGNFSVRNALSRMRYRLINLSKIPWSNLNASDDFLKAGLI